jgi:predicted nicotinamide N-methyase
MPSTEYRGPVTSSRAVVAGVPLVLTRPAEPDRMLDDPAAVAWNRADDYMPYWAYLWPGAFLLAEAVAAREWAAGVKTLEIGCGLGLAGLTAVRCGASVVFSDYDEAPLEFVARSAAANGFDPSRWSTRRIDWRSPPSERFAVVLGADVLYERRLVPLVADVLAAVLAPGGVGMIADPYRVSAEAFPAEVRSRGMTCEAVAVTADGGELGAVAGTMHMVEKV